MYMHLATFLSRVHRLLCTTFSYSYYGNLDSSLLSTFTSLTLSTLLLPSYLFTEPDHLSEPLLITTLIHWRLSLPLMSFSEHENNLKNSDVLSGMRMKLTVMRNCFKVIRGHNVVIVDCVYNCMVIYMLIHPFVCLFILPTISQVFKVLRA